jgi:hypothetical protein
VQESLPSADEGYVHIVGMEGGPSQHGYISIGYALNVLNHYGIPSEAGGSIGYSVAVPAPLAARAESLLRTKHTGLHGFVTWLRTGEKDPVPPLEHAEEQIACSYRAAVVRYPENSVVGRVLRHPVISDLVATGQLGYVEEVQWTERPYLTRDLSPATAIAARVGYSRGQSETAAAERVQYRHVALMPE